MLGKTVTVIVDRPLGSVHPHHKNIVYPINYGYISDIIAPDGEEQDAYILGVDTPLKSFTGKVIAIIHRKNDVENKWVVAHENANFTEKEILEAVYFQEHFFDIDIDI
ncbi:MAG: inorganic pyrophosphatase [Clostridia bacterium]|nr:inorganic pyrophosphatase [Clostridia bacterium]